jgi:hypothetical protein
MKIFSGSPAPPPRRAPLGLTFPRRTSDRLTLGVVVFLLLFFVSATAWLLTPP